MKKLILVFLSILLLMSFCTEASAGNYSSQISSVASQFSHQNAMADNIYQQICNGTYRTTEFLNIIAYLCDR